MSMGCWIFVMDELLYKKSLLLDWDSSQRSVGVDVLCVGGGVLVFLRTGWVRFWFRMIVLLLVGLFVWFKT